MTNTSNLYRKARALTAKTVAAGCTAPEHASATNLAVSIIRKHGLDAVRIAWPEPPKGWCWSGIVGQSEVVEMPVKTEAKPRGERRPKTPPETKPKRPTRYDRVAEMLQRPEGVTIAQMMAEFGILAHTARAMISIGKRRAGMTVTYDKATKVYRAVAA